MISNSWKIEFQWTVILRLFSSLNSLLTISNSSTSLSDTSLINETTTVDYNCKMRHLNERGKI